MGVTPNHPFLFGIFHEINHPAIGVSPFMETPIDHWGAHTAEYHKGLCGKRVPQIHCRITIFLLKSPYSMCTPNFQTYIPKNNIKLVMQYIPFHTHYELLYSHCIPIIFQLYFIVFPLHSFYIWQQIFPLYFHQILILSMLWFLIPIHNYHIPTIIHIIISILVFRLYTVYIYIYIHTPHYIYDICYYSYVGYSRYSPDYKVQLDWHIPDIPIDFRRYSHYIHNYDHLMKIIWIYIYIYIIIPY